MLRREVAVFALLAGVAVLAAPTPSQSAMCASGGSLEEQANVEVAAALVYTHHEYTCKECHAMVDSLQSFCRNNFAVSKPVRGEFVHTCYDATGTSTTDFDNLEDKCGVMYDFVSQLYCPLDPCVQVTTEEMQAHDSICHLLRCNQGPEAAKEKGTANVPLTCPAYVEHILGMCKELKDEKGPNRVGGGNDTTCNLFPVEYTREGCGVVLDTMVSSVSPLDLCDSLKCDGVFDADLDKYCRDVLKLPAKGPVPEPGYLQFLKSGHDVFCANHSQVAITIKSASYGASCSDSLRDNILDSVRRNCNGKIKCTFGNRNLQNMTSEWDVLASARANDANFNATCRPNFEVVYSCHHNATDLTITAPESAKFSAIPFDCVHELVGKDALRAFKIRNDLEAPRH